MDFVTLRRSGDSVSAERCLERLLCAHAEPVIRRVARRKLFSGAHGATYDMQDEEDVRNSVVLHLLSRLQALGESTAELTSFPAYVAGIARNCCSDLIRRKYPAYWRLKNRIRYLCRHSNLLRLQQVDNEWLCGLAAWKSNRQEVVAEGRIELSGFVASLPPGSAVRQMKLEELAHAFLMWRDRWVPLDDLVKIIAEMFQVREAPRAVSIDEETRAGLRALLVDPAPDPGSRAELRSSLEKLWAEIRGLPRGQRVALLLNLRDEEQRDALTLLPLTGVATLEEIAVVLEIPIESFMPIWGELPLDDLAIADVLGSTRQQVINMRKSGRERLARRMAATKARTKS